MPLRGPRHIPITWNAHWNDEPAGRCSALADAVGKSDGPEEITAGVASVRISGRIADSLGPAIVSTKTGITTSEGGSRARRDPRTNARRWVASAGQFGRARCSRCRLAEQLAAEHETVQRDDPSVGWLERPRAPDRDHQRVARYPLPPGRCSVAVWSQRSQRSQRSPLVAAVSPWSPRSLANARPQ